MAAIWEISSGLRSFRREVLSTVGVGDSSVVVAVPVATIILSMKKITS